MLTVRVALGPCGLITEEVGLLRVAKLSSCVLGELVRHLLRNNVGALRAVCYCGAVSIQDEQSARKARAEARRSRMTIEIVKLGQPKASPYAEHSPEERLAAAVH